MVVIEMEEKACMCVLASLRCSMELHMAVGGADSEPVQRTKQAVAAILKALEKDHSLLACAIARDFEPIWGDKRE